MKFTADKFKKKDTPVIKRMPEDLQTALKGLSIVDALKRKLITELGDDKGNFIFEHENDEVDAKYAIIEGYGVIVSSALADLIDEMDDDAIGDLTFSKDISTTPGPGFNKPFFRLGLPQGIRLGAAVKTFAAEPVNEE